MKAYCGATLLAIEQGDITAFAADAIVNAANSSLLGGGGVDGAIHRAGGKSILEECKKLRGSMPMGCPPGQAVITSAGDLPAKYVIHTVGPIWRGGNSGEPDILASCYANSLSLAVEHCLKTVAFPSVSTGAYGYPAAQAAKTAVGAVRRFVEDRPDALLCVTWVLFDAGTFDEYCKALAR